MSRYIILLLLNVPFIIAGLVSTTINYKLSKISKLRFLFRAAFWLIIFVGLASTKTIYEFLFSNKLTRTEPLSLFDVIEITGIIGIFFIVNKTRARMHNLERKVQELNQELSIKLSSRD